MVKNAQTYICVNLLRMGWTIGVMQQTKPYLHTTYDIGDNKYGYYSVHYKTIEALKRRGVINEKLQWTKK